MRCVIVLGGDPPSNALLLKVCQNADFVLCADAGATVLKKNHILPMAVIGDMDSVSEEVLTWCAQKGASIYHLNPIKDETDGCAALDLALSLGATDITLLGALGGRMDHALGNLTLLLRAHKHHATARLRSDTEEICLITGKETLCGKIGQLLSLLPLGPDVLVKQTSGLAYPLKDKVMPVDFPLGISNVFTEDAAVVWVGRGMLLAIKNV